MASHLKISQSSVIKFCQKLGFKGYPNLKFSIGEAVARDGNGAAVWQPETRGSGAHETLAEDLWRNKTQAEEETRLINAADIIEAAAAMIDRAAKVFVAGVGDDGVAARAFAMKLELEGRLERLHANLEHTAHALMR